MRVIDRTDCPDQPVRRQPHPPLSETSGVRAGAVVAVALLAIYNLFWKLAASDWFVDELLYVQTGRRYIDGAVAGDVGHPPLALLLFGIGDRLFGHALPGPRIVPGLIAMATGVVLFCFGRSIGGFWTGVLAAALWFAVPRPARSAGYTVLAHRMDRYAMLDATAGFFLVLGLFLAWRWFETGAWPWPIAAGVSLGCALASKVPGGTGIVVVVITALLVLPRDRRTRNQVVALVGVAVLVVVGSYLPFGRRAPSAFELMVRAQSSHASEGHRIMIGGHSYQYAPWWAHLAYQWADDGKVVTLAIVGGVVAAALAVRRRAFLFLLGGVVAPMALLILSPVALPHYREVWMPLVMLLVALGVGGLARAAADGGRGATLLGRAATVLVLAPLVASAVADSARLAGDGPGDYQRAGRLIARSIGASGEVVVAGHPPTADAYLPRSVTVVASPDPRRAADAVIVDPIWSSRFPAGPVISYARQLGLRPTTVGRLQVWLPPGR